jgi:GAF domain-containing protein
LLVLSGADGLRIAGSLVPPGEDASALLHAVTPWLTESSRTRAVSLPHRPDGAEPIDQRSCLIAPLLGDHAPLGYLYAGVEGSIGRFHDADHMLLATLASQAGVALANIRLREALQDAVAERAAELQQRTSELAVIESIQQGMAGALDFRGIIELVGDKLRTVFRRDNLGIHRYAAVRDLHLHRRHGQFGRAAGDAHESSGSRCPGRRKHTTRVARSRAHARLGRRTIQGEDHGSRDLRSGHGEPI